jgi:hypothetical protein
MKDLVCVKRLTIYIIYIIGVFIRINLVEEIRVSGENKLQITDNQHNKQKR